MSFTAAFASANGASTRLAVSDKTYSPLLSQMAFSPLEAETIITEDFSRGSAAEPVFTKLVAPANTLSTGTVRALVINIHLPNGAGANRELLAPGYQAGADQIKQMSRGLLEIQVDYFGRNVVVDVPDCSSTSTNTIATKALEQATIELDLDDYRFISFVIPQSLGCTFAGLAYTSSRNSWNVSDGRGFQAGTVAHEWGHNLSLDHSNAMRCSVNNAPMQFATRVLRGQGACTSVESSGAYSRMGSGNAGTITFLERLQLGWLREGEFVTAYQGTYTLNFDGAPALLMLQNSEGDIFMIEYGRATTPPSGTSRYDWFTKQLIPGPFVNGVIVHYLSEYKIVSTTPGGYKITSFVLDMNPSTSHVLDALLRAGQSFIDPTGSLQIDVASVGEYSATVNVRGIPFRPSAPTGFVVTQQSTLGVIDVSWAPVVATAPVIHYEIQISKQSDFAEGATTKFGIVGTISPVAIPNAEYGKYYFVRVAAVNAGGLSDFAQTSTLANWTKPVKNMTNKVGGACTPNGSRVKQGQIKLICKTVGGKLIWKRG